MDNIIFLDFDGVINSESWYERRLNLYEDSNIFTEKYPLYEFDPDSINILNKIIKKIKGKLVITSTWRLGRDIKNLQKLCDLVNIQGEVIDKTIDLNNGYGDISIPRGLEIDHWLKNVGNFKNSEHSDFIYDRNKDLKVNNYVIIDDDTDMLYEQKNNFIKINRKISLTESDYNKIIKIFHK